MWGNKRRMWEERDGRRDGEGNEGMVGERDGERRTEENKNGGREGVHD